MAPPFPRTAFFKALIPFGALACFLSCGGGKPDIKHDTPPAKILSFLATPPVVMAGDEVVFHGKIENGQATVFRDANGNGVLEKSEEESGKVGAISNDTTTSDKPIVTTHYILKASNMQGDSQFASVQVKVLENPEKPKIEAPKEVEKGVKERASVDTLPGYTYQWNVTNVDADKWGALESPAGKNSIWFTPNGVGPVGLSCVAQKGGKDSAPDAISIPLKVLPEARKSITRFEIPTQIEPSKIDHEKLEIRVVMPSGTPLQALKPLIEHNGAEVAPKSGEAQDFSESRFYTVKAQDGSSHSYKVIVVCAELAHKPVIHGFEASPKSIVEGDEVELKAYFENGDGLLKPGEIKVESGVSVFLSPEAITTYTLTVRNKAGEEDSRSLTVEVKTEVAVPELVAPDRVAVGGRYPAQAKALKGYTYEWAFENVSEPKINEKDSSQVSFAPDGRGDVVLKCWAINPKGKKSKSEGTRRIPLDVSADSRKEITGFSLPGQLAIKLDEPASLIWIQMPAGTPLNALVPEIQHTGYAIVPASGVSQDFTQPVEYIVEAMDKTTRTYKVQVLHKFVPTLTAKANPVDFGASTDITPQFDYGTGTVDGKAVESGKAFNSGVITEDKRFELKVETVFGPEPPVVLTIQCQKVSVKVTPETVSVAPGARQAFAAEVKGTTNQAVVWSATGGKFAEGNVWIAPEALGSYTITAKAQDGSNAFGTATATVVEQLTGSLVRVPDNAGNSVAFDGTVTLKVQMTPGATGIVTQDAGPDLGPFKDKDTFDIKNIKTLRTFNLKVTKNGAAGYTSPALTVTPTPVIMGPIAPDKAIVTVGGQVQFKVPVTGGATSGVKWTVDNVEFNGLWNATAPGNALTVVATSLDDPTQFKTTTVQAVAQPTAELIVSNTSPLYGDTITVTPKWSGATATLTGVGPEQKNPSSDAAITMGPITGPVTFVLKALNGANTPASATADKPVTPQTVVMDPITAVDPGKGNAAVDPAAPIASGGSRDFNTQVKGAKDTNVKWSIKLLKGATPVAINADSGVWQAPVVTEDHEVEVTATSVADGRVKQVVKVTVVAPPGIKVFSALPESVDLTAGEPLETQIYAEFIGGKAELFMTDNRPNSVWKSCGEFASHEKRTLDVYDPWKIVKKPTEILYSGVTKYKLVVYNINGNAERIVNVSSFDVEVIGPQNVTRIARTCLLSGQLLTVSPNRFFRLAPFLPQSTPLSPLQPNRHLPSVTLLQDGRVLIAGGRVGEKSINSAELYDPATDQFTYVGGMNEARHGHSATLLPDGRVLMVGGASSNVLDSMEVYDPKTQMFTRLDQRLNSPRAFHCANLLKNGQLLLSGGTDLDGLTGALTLLDTTSFKTHELNPIAPRQFHGSILLPDGRVLFTGGLGVDGPLVTVECLDSETGLLEAKESLPKPRYGHQVHVQDQKVICAGGPLEAEYVDCFDLVKGQWQRLLQEAEVEAAIPQEKGLSLYLKGASTRNSRFKTIEIKP